MGQRLSYWVFLGAIGFAAFFLLRQSIALNAGGPIEDSKATVEERAAEISAELGFSADTLNMLVTRSQHLNFYDELKDSLGNSLPSPYELNRRDLNLTGWNVILGTTLTRQEIFTFTANDIFDKVGSIQYLFDGESRVRRLKTHPENPNPSFVAGDSLSAIAEYVVGNIFAYDLSNYVLNTVNVSDSLVSNREPDFRERRLNATEGATGSSTVFEFRWTKNNPDYLGPVSLSLELSQMVKELTTNKGTSIKYGASIEHFQATDRPEPIQLGRSFVLGSSRFIVSLLSLGILVILVFYQGIKHINKGQVEWKRAISIMLGIGLGFFSWRAIYFLNTVDPFLDGTSTLIYLFYQLVIAGSCGLYAAFAYIGWEAIARAQNQKQMHLLDAFWRKRFFFRETGDSILRGYTLGGILLGLFAVLLYLLDTVYYQADSQFGFAEASMQPKLLTVNLAAWINVLLVTLGHAGLAIGFMMEKLKKDWELYSLGILVLGILFGGSALLTGVNGPIWYKIFVLGMMAPAMIFAIQKSGLLTFSIGWWVFTVILLIMPYWGSSSLDVAYIPWVQGIILLVPLVYGFITLRYAESVTEIGGYIPEYQERMAKHLRVEKEIEIARESQFRLMPLKPPDLSEVDVYGFFMPSFEVGGDYFDYVVNQNGKSDPHALTMTIADVSGKSMKAAMHAVFTSGLLLSRLHKDRPESILQEVAPTLFNRTDPQTFITCIIAQYNFGSKRLDIANAGHCLPVLKRDGKAEFIRTPDPKYPLGLKTEVNYEALEVSLEKGDFILLYSDGLPEAVDSKGNRFGFDEVLTLIESMDTETQSSNEIALEIKRRIQKFSDHQLADDTTIICLKV